VFFLLHSLKSTDEAALGGIFSIATMVTLFRLWFSDKKICGMGGDGSNYLQDGSESVWGRVGMGVKSAG